MKKRLLERMGELCVMGWLNPGKLIPTLNHQAEKGKMLVRGWKITYSICRIFEYL